MKVGQYLMLLCYKAYKTLPIIGPPIIIILIPIETNLRRSLCVLLPCNQCMHVLVLSLGVGNWSAGCKRVLKRDGVR